MLDAKDLQAVQQTRLLNRLGTVDEVTAAGMVRCAGISAGVGELCMVRDHERDQNMTFAEVIAFAPGGTWVSCLTPPGAIRRGMQVLPLGTALQVEVGQSLKGRVLNGFGRPFDDGPPIQAEMEVPVSQPPVHYSQRGVISQPFQTGVRSIDGLLTVGRGQRLAILAPAGVGKSTLLQQIGLSAEADCVVVALIGERGREVLETIHAWQRHPLGKRCIFVAAPASSGSLERLKAAFVAATVAEWFAKQGENVLLLMDSVTRLARAQREIGLAAGEQPTRRGYPPSLFTMLPMLFERAGSLANGGSVTGFYTVLVEDEQEADPIAEEVVSLIDGHFVLSRTMASTGHYPAIDVQKSISRLMPKIVEPAHVQLAGHFRELTAKYADIEFLLQVGEYEPGRDKLADKAIDARAKMQAFLRQKMDERIGIAQTRQALQQAMQTGAA